MKNITILIAIAGIMVILMGCSSISKPTMVHSQSGSQKEYRELLEEKRNILLSFEGHPDYEALVWSDDIEIFDYNLLGFIPIYRNLNIFIINGDKVLLKDIPQGIKNLHVILIPKTDNRYLSQSKYALRERMKRVRGEILLNIGTEENRIRITDPESIYIQQIVNIENAVSLKKEQQDELEIKKINTPEEYLMELES